MCDIPLRLVSTPVSIPTCGSVPRAVAALFQPTVLSDCNVKIEENWELVLFLWGGGSRKLGGNATNSKAAESQRLGETNGRGSRY